METFSICAKSRNAGSAAKETVEILGVGRVAVDFGVGQGAKRSADIPSDLGQASNAGQRQNQRNPGGRETERQLATSLARYSPVRGCASLAPCHPPFCLYARPIPVFQQSPSSPCDSRKTYYNNRRRNICSGALLGVGCFFGSPHLPQVGESGSEIAIHTIAQSAQRQPSSPRRHRRRD